MNLFIRILTIVCFIAPLTTRASDENWPHWRGPHYTGAAEATGLPVEWGPEKNLRWKTVMPGESAATPAVWGDRVFVSSRDERSGDLLAMCLDLKNGEEVWRKTVGVDAGANRRQNMASPSPVTDGKRAIFLYGSGDLAAYDLDGVELWKRNLQREYGRFQIQFGYASSPTLYEDRLYLTVLQRSPDSFLMALNPDTGEELFKHIRPTDAKQESMEAYTTPIPFEGAERKEILVMGGDCITGHDPATGEELWRWAGYNPRKIGHWRIVPSAVTGGGLVFAPAPKREPLYALKAGLSSETGDDAVSWKFDAAPPDVCTPAYHDGRLYVFDGDRYVMTCVDVSSGETMWSGELESSVVFRASPTLADGKLYCVNENGLVYVLEAGDEFKILNRIEMGGSPVRASIAAVGSKLLIRTAEALYCVEQAG
ncbi:MAG: PQQ-binding-like beta-propeller repeat protein [bacterium]|nr:PQQ-binding-like beta-propeller repeat protein [bacterium]